jgi:hypothetical protein
MITMHQKKGKSRAAQVALKGDCVSLVIHRQARRDRAGFNFIWSR